ncbi:hypothetical protein pb186bvf_006383 [Paramecium bursaria]
MDKIRRSTSRMRSGRYGSAEVQNNDSTKLLKPLDVTFSNQSNSNKNDEKEIKQIIVDAIKGSSNRKQKIKSKKDHSSEVSRSLSRSLSLSSSRSRSRSSSQSSSNSSLLKKIRVNKGGNKKVEAIVDSNKLYLKIIIILIHIKSLIFIFQQIINSSIKRLSNLYYKLQMIKTNPLEQAKQGDLVIGIDFGTSNLRASVFRNNQIQIIPDEEGSLHTPAYVQFNSDNILIGKDAKDSFSDNPQNTIYDIKRFIGRQFNDPFIQEQKNLYQFQIAQGYQERVAFEIFQNNQSALWYPEQILSLLLKKIIQISEKFLKCKVYRAVISIASNFNNQQRLAVLDAAKLASLTVLKLVPECSLAALAFGNIYKTKQETNIMIYDIGAGKLDVSLFCFDEEIYEVKQLTGDLELGGLDFDNRIINYYAEQLLKQLNQKFDLQDLNRKREQFEQVKNLLSQQVTTNIDGVKMEYQQFYLFCEDLFQRCVQPVIDILKESKLNLNQIAQIVVIGGFSKSIFLRKLLTKILPGKILNFIIDPDLAIAQGAAIIAAIRQGKDHPFTSTLCLECTPYQIGTQDSVKNAINIISRNATYPLKKFHTMSTSYDNQKETIIQLTEGDKKENNHLAFKLENITSSPKGVPIIEIMYLIDSNGILNLQADETIQKNKKNLTINQIFGNMPQNELDKMKNQIESISPQLHLQNFLKLEKKKELMDLLKNLQQMINSEQFRQIFTDSFYQNLNDKINQTNDYLQQNVGSLKYCQEKIDYFIKKQRPIIEIINNNE